MQAIFEMFNDRIKEIDLYYKALQELDTIPVPLDEAPPSYCNGEFIKILKANALLMIYNLVESTVVGSITEIYDRLRQDGLTYQTVNKQIKNIWFSYKFKQVYDQKAHYHSYKEKALEIVNSIMTGEVIELDRRATEISGNLDAQQIRNVCSDHGISFSIDESCKGGIMLEAVKCQRNSLAHGTLSFAECGRDYSLLDLEEIKAQAIIFLQGLLAGMNDYYNQKTYMTADQSV